MKTAIIVSIVFIGLSLGGCAPLIVGGLAGAAVYQWDRNHYYYGHHWRTSRGRYKYRYRNYRQ